VGRRGGVATRILPRWPIGRQRSVVLMETETGVICCRFADSVWVLDLVQMNDSMSSASFVLEHPSGETRK
jgi:hypothetical protein